MPNQNSEHGWEEAEDPTGGDQETYADFVDTAEGRKRSGLYKILHGGEWVLHIQPGFVNAPPYAQEDTGPHAATDTVKLNYG